MIPSRKTPELTHVRRLKPEVGQNIATHASLSARNSSYRNLDLPVQFTFIFIQILSQLFNCISSDVVPKAGCVTVWADGLGGSGRCVVLVVKYDDRGGDGYGRCMLCV